MPKRYTPEEKAQILARVAEIGAAAAAKEAGVNYNSVLNWVKAAPTVTSAGNSVKNTVKKIAALPVEALERINAYISKTEEEIRNLEETLKQKKSELKALQKYKTKAEKEKELFEAAEQKKQLIEAVMNSGKSVEEIMGFLQGQ